VSIADLRYPIESQERTGDRWSQWSSQPMIEVSALDTYQFVKAMIPSPGQRILEIGCGNGYLTLELAREGHTVVGLDKSQDILAVAEQTRKAHPETPDFGKLDYICADASMWSAGESSFDVVVLNRTLHHLHHFQAILDKIQRLLTPNGLLICQDYAYDRLNDRTASWVYGMQRLLFLSDLSTENPTITANDLSSIEALKTAWFEKAEKREHRLNRYDEMVQAFSLTFAQQLVSWVPYLFVYIGNGIRSVSPEKERALIVFLKNMEQHGIDTEMIQSVGFRYVGTVQK
jgi:2-polyprenyl-3-methyl-5-hydroxy-6-metoxy-1,4-benzoquinol methylase